MSIGLTTHIDDEYRWAGVEDPKIMVTTSRDPSSKLKQFAKVFICILYLYFCSYIEITLISKYDLWFFLMLIFSFHVVDNVDQSGLFIFILKNGCGLYIGTL